MAGIIVCPFCDSLVLTLKDEFNCRNCGSIIYENWRKELIIKKPGSVSSKELIHVIELRMISEEDIMMHVLEYISEHPGSTINDIARALGIDT
jgi:RNA polymerase subunit RPABC4/transcription elongation factor Spt4